MESLLALLRALGESFLFCAAISILLIIGASSHYLSSDWLYTILPLFLLCAFVRYLHLNKRYKTEDEKAEERKRAAGGGW